MPIDFRASQIQTNKIIASGSTGTETGAQIVIYSHLADDGTAPNQGFIDQSVFVTSSIGTDIFLYVSGGIGERNVGGAKSISVFGGDVYVSGNMAIENGFSASLQQLPSGIPYLLAGPNVTITTNSLGQVEVSSSGGGGGGGGGSSFYRLEVLDYYATNNTSTTTAGQVIFPANQFTGSLVLYGVIANSSTTATGSIRLYNVTSGSYVHIGGPGNQYLSVSGVNPTIVSSVDLISASNFNSSSQAIYELQVSSSNGGSTAFFGGFELRPSGSFTGISYVTSSYFYTYTSGTWEDGGNKLATTSSVAVTGLQGPGFFADNVGADVFFYVSGSSGSKDTATPGVAVFGGDVVISGVLYGGSPLKISGSVLQGHQTSATGLFTHAEGFETIASGIAAHAEGANTTAAGNYSHAEGGNTTAAGEGSHSEGGITEASGQFGHAEGYRTLAYGYAAHAEGYFATGSGDYSHAEGENTKAGILGYSVVNIDLVAEAPNALYTLDKAYGDVSSQFSGGETIITSDTANNGPFGIYGYVGTNSDGTYTYVTASNDYTYPTYIGTYAISNTTKSLLVGADKKIGGYSANASGYETLAIGAQARASGETTISLNNSSNAEGKLSIAIGAYSHAEGRSTSSGEGSHSEGYGTVSSGSYSHAEGYSSLAVNFTSHAEGSYTTADGISSHSEGYGTIAHGDHSHAEGFANEAVAIGSHAEGKQTTSSGSYSHVEGYKSTTTGSYSHAEGFFTTSEGIYSHAEGSTTKAYGDSSHAEGLATVASGNYSHAEGNFAKSYGKFSHAEGGYTKTYGQASHTEGYYTEAVGDYSHAGGQYTIASGSGQTVVGTYNQRNNNISLLVVGNGIGDLDANRSDIFRVNNAIVEVTGSFSVSGSQSTLHQYNCLRYYPTIVTSLPYTASLNDYIIAVSASAGAGVKLPASEFGRTFVVKDVSGSATMDNITITAAGGELIDGSPNAIIGIDYGSAKFVYFGSGRGWGVI